MDSREVQPGADAAGNGAVQLQVPGGPSGEVRQRWYGRVAPMIHLPQIGTQNLQTFASIPGS